MNDTNEKNNTTEDQGPFPAALEYLRRGELPGGWDDLGHLPDAELLILAAAGWWQPWVHISDDATLRNAWEGRLPESMIPETDLGIALAYNPHLPGDILHNLVKTYDDDGIGYENPNIEPRTLHLLVTRLNSGGSCGYTELATARIVAENPGTWNDTLKEMALNPHSEVRDVALRAIWDRREQVSA